jgi:ABC-2 type transport system ATP-binding protein
MNDPSSSAVVVDALRCTGLSRRFGDRVAVDDVSFRIAAGETYGLLGPNGAGKTTTISLITGILAADAGTVLVGGERITTTAGAAKGRIGLVPQDIALYPDLTARENLRFFGRLQGLGRVVLARRIDAVLDVVGLRDRADDRIDEYSGGMKRRANVAVGLLHEPSLLILDEPTVGVDPQSRNQILESVEALGAEGMAVLYTTHYMEEAERLCARVGIIDDGRLIAEGTRRELIDRVGGHDRIDVEAAGDLTGLRVRLLALAEVTAVDAIDGGLRVTAAGGRRALAPVVLAADASDVQVAGIDVREPDLEDVFLHLTGKALRD